MPIIAEVAIQKRIRPERALSMSVTAAHMGITASPVSAATAALLTVLSASGIKLGDILKVCIPSTIIGVLVGILFVYKRGKELECGSGISGTDEGSGFCKKSGPTENQTAVTPLKPGASKSVIIFGLAVLAVVLVGSFPALLPEFSEKENFAPGFAVNAAGQLQVPSMIMMIMLAAAGLIILFANTKAAQVTKASLFSSAGSAAIAVFGVVWMSSTFMNNNAEVIENTLGKMVTAYPWLFAVALFALSIFTVQPGCNNQSADAPGFDTGTEPGLSGWNISRNEWSFFYSRIPDIAYCHSI